METQATGRPKFCFRLGNCLAAGVISRKPRCHITARHVTDSTIDLPRSGADDGHAIRLLKRKMQLSIRQLYFWDDVVLVKQVSSCYRPRTNLSASSYEVCLVQKKGKEEKEEQEKKRKEKNRKKKGALMGSRKIGMRSRAGRIVLCLSAAAVVRSTNSKKKRAVPHTRGRASGRADERALVKLARQIDKTAPPSRCTTIYHRGE
jgi:hypothetical protein